MDSIIAIIEKLYRENTASREELKQLLSDNRPETAKALREKAHALRQKNYGNKVFIRGLIEFTNICKNDCYYCGIRRSQESVSRYRLTDREILQCCKEGYRLGFRTFVLQGGEDGYWDDSRMTDLIYSIKSAYPDCALTLSIGERSKESYRNLFDAGADRYLLRHETADASHYGKLHPPELSLKHRMDCLCALKDMGFQTGCGFMVGTPFQTPDNIVSDLLFIKAFQPAMVGIGPFIPAAGTPFEKESAGSADLTVKILSIVRLMNPKVLLPATTALGTAETDGRERGILAGANVVMPNLSPANVREKYRLYDNKISGSAEAAEGLNMLKARMAGIGFDVVCQRGDHPDFE